MKKTPLIVACCMMAALLLATFADTSAAATLVKEIDFILGSHTGQANITASGNPAYPYSGTITETGTWYMYGITLDNQRTSQLPITGSTITIGGSNLTLTRNNGNGTNSTLLTGIIGADTESRTTSFNKYAFTLFLTSVNVIGTELTSIFTPAGPLTGTLSVGYYQASPNWITPSSLSIPDRAVPAPVPPSLLLLAPGLIGLVTIRKRARA